MYHGEPRSRAQERAEAAAEHSRDVGRLAHIRRCQQRDEQRSNVGIPLQSRVIEARDAHAIELHEKIYGRSVVARVSDYTDNGGQSLAQCRQLAQTIADYLAGRPVRLSDPPDDPESFAVYTERRERIDLGDRITALLDTAMRAEVGSAGLARIANADIALVQTLEAAIYQGVQERFTL